MRIVTTSNRIAPGRRGVSLLLAVFLAAAAISLWPNAPARTFAAKDTVWLAPHRAVYDMALDRTRSADNIAAVRGRMVFEFGGSACEGYTLNIRLVTEMTSQEGGSAITDLRSSTWEDGKGEEFRFNSTQYRDEKITDAASGNAEREPSGPGVVVDLKKPEEEKLHYSGSILFPTQHSLHVLEAAQQGRRMVQARIFDGSEKGRRLYKTTAFIGKMKPPDGKSGKGVRAANDEELDELRSWPVTIGYFDGLAEEEAVPDYEMSFRLFANGVSRDIMIDYGDFAVRGDLSSLEFFKPTKCE